MAVCTSLLGLRTAAFGGGGSPCRREKNVERACKKSTTIMGLESADVKKLRSSIPSLPLLPTREDASLDVNVPTAAFDALAERYRAKQQRREATSKLLHVVCRKGNEAIYHLHRGELVQADQAIEEASTKLQQSLAEFDDDGEGRWGSLSGAIENNVRAKTFANFLRTGQVLRRSEVPFATYNEYLPGVIGFSNELERYAIKRASDKDARSVMVCKNVVELINSQLMLFDFRNGPIRHRYDSMKYVVRKMEDTLFELSLVHEIFDPEVMEDANSTSKNEEVMQDADAPTILDLQEFDQMRQEMEAFDEKREIVIKKCRDLQKLCKNSIYDLHRGNLEKAKKQLDGVKESSNEILSVIATSPGLRNGAFEGVMEEYAEAYLFYQFLQDGRILELADLEPINANEYMGGILDFTGEVARYAVAQATKRDVAQVKRCMDVVDQIIGLTIVIPDMPHQVIKKVDVAKSTLKKLETIIYEMSLSRKPQSNNMKEEKAPQDDSA